MKESIIKSKLSQSALNIGAGSPTDAGLSFRGETDHPNPQQLRSQRRFDCEQGWQASSLPVQILRLP